MTDGLSARAIHRPTALRVAHRRRSAPPPSGERPLSSAVRISWTVKLLGMFTVIGLQILFSLEIGISSSPSLPISVDARAKAATAAGVSDERLVSGSTTAEVTAHARSASSGLPHLAERVSGMADPAAAHARHPWIGDGRAVLSGLILLGASDPVLRSRMSATR